MLLNKILSCLIITTMFKIVTFIYISLLNDELKIEPDYETPTVYPIKVLFVKMHFRTKCTLVIQLKTKTGNIKYQKANLSCVVATIFSSLAFLFRLSPWPT